MNLNTNGKFDFFEKETIINCSAIFWAFCFTLLFFSLNRKVNSFTIDELNIYPNFLYLYVLQFISFQLFGFLMMVTLYAKNKKMTETLFKIWKTHI